MKLKPDRKPSVLILTHKGVVWTQLRPILQSVYNSKANKYT